MRPRCAGCGWHLDGIEHSALECVAHMAAQLAASRDVLESRTRRGVDVTATRAALRDVVAMGGAS